MTVADRYVGWRVADIRGSAKRNSPLAVQGREKGMELRWASKDCSVCGEAVWFQVAHVGGRVLVCWRCAE